MEYLDNQALVQPNNLELGLLCHKTIVLAHVLLFSFTSARISGAFP